MPAGTDGAMVSGTTLPWGRPASEAPPSPLPQPDRPRIASCPARIIPNKTLGPATWRFDMTLPQGLTVARTPRWQDTPATSRVRIRSRKNGSSRASRLRIETVSATHACAKSSLTLLKIRHMSRPDTLSVMISKHSWLARCLQNLLKRQPCRLSGRIDQNKNGAPRELNVAGVYCNARANRTFPQPVNLLAISSEQARGQMDN